ncbi:MAG TPA: CpsD/CapB family tyrosine-protein kinase [Terriglobales bacterium]|nr:CpsD/CapB family tyrosine-protein kinase [Terriglobales bacterium]
MGLFYTALERAEQNAEAETRPKDLAADASAAQAAPAARPPVMTWEQAEHSDLAGYALPVPEAAPEPAPEPILAIEVVHRAVQLAPALLGSAGDALDSAKEQFRMLRSRILEAMHGQGLRTLLITSPGAGEGKTFVACNLARLFSTMKEGRVLLIDADLRRAGLSAGLQPRPTTGLNHYLKGEIAWEDALCPVDGWLTVLPAISTHEEASELLASQKMAELLLSARERFDLVLLDAAPVAPVADSRILARIADATLLVVRAGRSDRHELERTAGMLRPGLLGTVWNGTSDRRSRYGYPYGESTANEATPAVVAAKEPEA